MASTRGGAHKVAEAQSVPFKGDCGKCGARRFDVQLGLEKTPEEYVARLVEIFREVKRVLRTDGTLWLNLGDSYGTGTTAARVQGSRGLGANTQEAQDAVPRCGGIAKQLIGIPWRVAFALQSDGWYLRSDIIWSKPNPMPESVTDRPTKSHEYIFLLAKGQSKSRTVKLADLSGDCGHLVRSLSGSSPDIWAARLSVGLATSILNSAKIEQELSGALLESQIGQQSKSALSGGSVVSLPPVHRLAVRLLHGDASPKEFLSEIHRIGFVLGDSSQFLISGSNTKIPLPPSINRYGKASIAIHDSGKIGEFDFLHGQIIAHTPTTCSYYFDADAVKETVTSAFSIARNKSTPRNFGLRGEHNHDRSDRGRYAEITTDAGRNIRSVWTVATQPFSGAHFATFPPDLIKPCILAGAPVGGVVLDPFAGSGTTGKVAIELGRKAILIEPKAEYVEMIERRCRTTIGLPFMEATA